MVLTNIECWANSDGALGLDNVETEGSRRQVDLFNPRSVQQQVLGSRISGAQDISCISSNGYYGFSFINEIHTINSESQIINNVICDKKMDALVLKRCRKRCFVDAEILSNENNDNVSNGMYVEIVEHSPIGGKRCRFDGHFAARNCEDTFRSCSGIKTTQSSLMDIEECTEKFGQDQIRDQEPIPNSHSTQITEQQSNIAILQPRQQFHGHLHRANRDLSRCMLSHMI